MEKPLVWMGQTHKELLAMPDNVQDDFGYALGVAQLGGVVAFAKPMKGNLRDVMEVVSNSQGSDNGSYNYEAASATAGRQRADQRY